MKPQSLWAATLLAVGVGAVHSADLGNLDLSSGSNFFGNTPPAGAFSDTLSINNPYLAGGIVSGSITTMLNNDQDIDFTRITLWGPSLSIFGFVQLLPDPAETWALFPTLIPPRGYQLLIEGVNSTGRGSYSGNLALSAVPQPAPWSLAAAGLALLAAIQRWRARSVVAVRRHAIRL